MNQPIRTSSQLDTQIENVGIYNRDDKMLQKRLKSLDASEYGVQQFIKIAERYETLTELDREVLNRMIESITVGDRIKNGAETEQEICINYRFIGMVD